MCMCVGVLCRCYIRIDWATTFLEGGGLPLAKIIGSSGVYPDYMFCNYNRLAMLSAKLVPNNRHIKNKIKSSGVSALYARPLSQPMHYTHKSTTLSSFSTDLTTTPGKCNLSSLLLILLLVT